MTTAAPKTTPSDPSAPRKCPVIQPTPQNVFKNVDGFAYSEWVVRLPKEATLDDLKDPALWSKVQANDFISLKRFDRLLIVAWDESWIVECRVAGASHKGVSLSKPVKFDFDPRTEIQLDTPDYRVVWCGNGYAVQSKASGLTVEGPFATARQAEQALWARYPRSAA